MLSTACSHSVVPCRPWFEFWCRPLFWSSLRPDCAGHPSPPQEEARPRETPDQRAARRLAEERTAADRARQQSIRRGLASSAVSVNPDRVPTGRDPNPALSADRALNDLRTLAPELQGLVNIRPTAPDDRMRAELSERSERSLRAAREVLDFINRDSRVPASDSPAIPDEVLGDRLVRLGNVYLRLVEPAVSVISGDVLDVGVLEEVRSGFRLMEALIQAVPESRLADPGER